MSDNLTQEELLKILGEVLAGQAYTQLKEILKIYFGYGLNKREVRDKFADSGG